MGKRGPKKWTEKQWEESFWRKLDRETSPHGCWLWIGKLDKGYGVFRQIPYISAPRFSMQLFLGRVLKSEECVLHNCPGGDNRQCVNPEHLWIGTRSDNNLDRHKKGRTKWKESLGEDNGSSVLTEDQVRAIKKAVRGTQRMLASFYDVDESLITQIKQGKIWSSVD